MSETSNTTSIAPPGPDTTRTRRLIHETIRSFNVQLPPSLHPVHFDDHGISDLVDDETAIHCAANLPLFSLYEADPAKAAEFPPLLTPSDGGTLVSAPETEPKTEPEQTPATARPARPRATGKIEGAPTTATATETTETGV